MFITVVAAAVKVFCFASVFLLWNTGMEILTVELTVTVPVTVIVGASADLFTKSLLSISAALLARMSANLFLILA
jgi:hypothetical protein